MADLVRKAELFDQLARVGKWQPLASAGTRQRVALAGLVALALLALGEAAPAAFPVEVRIEGHGPFLQVAVDGQDHALSAVLGPGWRGIDLDAPGPIGREYQIDGSDTTSTDDRDPAIIDALLDTPLYRIDAWLRDESSYSRWERVRVVDLATGQQVPTGTATALPDDFRIAAETPLPQALTQDHDAVFAPLLSVC